MAQSLLQRAAVPSWAIAFEDGGASSRSRGPVALLRQFGSPGFRHVWAFGDFAGHEAGPLTVLVDPLAGRLDVRVMQQPIGVVSRRVLAQGGRVVVAEVEQPPQPRWLPMWSCVEVIKWLLGLRAPCVLTPRQLHQHLMRRGGIEVRAGGQREG